MAALIAVDETPHGEESSLAKLALDLSSHLAAQRRTEVGRCAPFACPRSNLPQRGQIEPQGAAERGEAVGWCERGKAVGGCCRARGGGRLV